jgi:alpha-glucosidase (family GH31 glycosyl hydrolase)
MDIPKGLWHDWRTAETVKGPCRRKVVTTPMWGGALYVKAGAIVPTWPQKQHIDRGWNDKVIVKVWPTADGEFTLHEDDGISLDYRKSGKSAKTKLSLKCEGDGAAFTIGARKGSFNGMPPTRDFSVEFYVGKRPSAATVDGKSVEGLWDEAGKTFTVAVGEVGVKEVIVRIK